MFETNRGVAGRFARLIAAFQDRIWAADEAFAADRRYDARRSPGGWSITVRDPRWDRRQPCSGCAATGCDPITGAPCLLCAGTGVVTLRVTDGGEQR